MGGVVKGIGGALGLGGSAPRAATLDTRPFQVQKEADRAKKQVTAEQAAVQQRAQQAQAGRQQLLSQLQAQAAGTGPSLAEAQLRSASNRNLAQQLSAAAAQRGGGAAQARQLARQQGQAGRQVAEQAAQTRIQESQNAQQQLGGILGQEQASVDQLAGKYIQMGYDFATAQKKALQEAQLAQFGARQQANLAASQQQSGLLGGLIGAGGSALTGWLSNTSSDKTKKKNIKSGSKEINSFLNALSAREYEYKNPMESGPVLAPSGKQVGIMAQDLEKSQVGKQMVENGPYGKTVNPTKGFGAVLAAQAELHKRVKELEKKRGK